LILVVASPALACSRHDDRPVDVTLSSLARYQEAYQGRLVRTEGVVRTYESSGQYWIEDNEPNRVALEPVHLVAPLLGQEVRVVGRFHFDDRTGRLIHIEKIAPTATTASTRSAQAGSSWWTQARRSGGASARALAS
jgi:hypothetical protein